MEKIDAHLFPYDVHTTFTDEDWERIAEVTGAPKETVKQIHFASKAILEVLQGLDPVTRVSVLGSVVGASMLRGELQPKHIQALMQAMMHMAIDLAQQEQEGQGPGSFRA